MALERAYVAVTAQSFRRVIPAVGDIWAWFVADFDDSDVVREAAERRHLFRGHPGLPDNLFSTINLPTVEVLVPPRARADGGARGRRRPRLFRSRARHRDSSLGGQPIAPLAPAAECGRPRAVQEEDGPPPGPFRPGALQALADIWGADWRTYLPTQVEGLYGGAVPDRFYRMRFIEVWDFGTLDLRDPRTPQSDWKWWGRRGTYGAVEVKFMESPPGGDWRRISPDSTSYALSFAHARPALTTEGASPESSRIDLPPLFAGLVDSLVVYCGEVDQCRSTLEIWEAHYGSESHLRSLRDAPSDPMPPPASVFVRYKSEHDGRPVLFGYDLRSEGVGVPYDRSRLAEAAEALLEEAWRSEEQRAHLQDQFLRYLLKTERWPVVDGVESLTTFEARTVAELVSTLRAMTRAEGTSIDRFVADLADRARLDPLFREVASSYWRDRRLLSDELIDRLLDVFDQSETQAFLEGVFRRVQDRVAMREFCEVTVVHSLKHAVRHLFLTEGSTRDEEVGSAAMFPLTHGRWSPDDSFYVYERNADGNGATRLVRDALGSSKVGHLMARWWDVSLSCPVGDEEDFLRAVFRRHGPALVDYANRFLSTPVAERESPRAFVEGLVPDVLAGEEGLLSRLAGMVTSSFSLAGVEIPLVALYVEVATLEDELASVFFRSPTGIEAGSHAATLVETAPERVPELARLYSLYAEHADQLGEQDEPDVTVLERFIDQVMHLSLRTCVDACPACLAGRCDSGPIESSRHTLSRRQLQRLHRMLTESFTVRFEGAATDVTQLVGLAGDNDGWLILKYASRLPVGLARELHEAFDEVARIFDHERLEVRRVLRLRSVP